MRNIEINKVKEQKKLGAGKIIELYLLLTQVNGNVVVSIGMR